MRRLPALIVLLFVSFNAVWCVDGCVDPFSDRDERYAATTLAMPDTAPSDTDVSVCVVCVVPFEKELTIALAPAWTLGGLVPSFDVSRPPLAPGHQVEHPPRVL